MNDPLFGPKDVIIIMQWYDFVPSSLYINMKVNFTMFNKLPLYIWIPTCLLTDKGYVTSKYVL
jgi:hypothetical protein